MEKEFINKVKLKSTFKVYNVDKKEKHLDLRRGLKIAREENPLPILFLGDKVFSLSGFVHSLGHGKIHAFVCVFVSEREKEREIES